MRHTFNKNQNDSLIKDKSCSFIYSFFLPNYITLYKESCNNISKSNEWMYLNFINKEKNENGLISSSSFFLNRIVAFSAFILLLKFM